MSAVVDAAPVFVPCAQGSEEWFKLRSGVITASRFFDCCTEKKSKPGELYDKGVRYAYKTAVEIISGEPYEEEEQYESWQMRRGARLEADARLRFEQETGLIMWESGIVFTADRRFGYSTDGYIEDRRGLGEIKVPSSGQKLFDLWASRDISEYNHQLQGGMWISGAEWAKLICYCPAMRSIGKDLLVIDVARDEAFIERMEEGLLKFRAMVDNIVRQLRGG